MKISALCHRSTLFLLPIALAGAQDFSYSKLSEARSKIPVVQMNDADKAATTNQASLLLQKIFVHQQTKVQDLKLDVAANAKKFVEDAAPLNGAEYFDKLGDLFLANRDLHTNYVVPSQILCYRSILPFTLDRVGEDHIVVTAIRKDLPAELTPGLAGLSLGDELMEYNGLAPMAAAESRAPLGAGANPDAWINGGIRYLYWNPSAKPNPAQDSVHLVFTKPPLNGQQQPPVVLDLPWIARFDLSCGEGAEPKSHPRTQRRSKQMFEGVEQEQLEINREYKNALRSEGSAFIVTAEPEIEYSILTNEKGKFGILRLNSFAPTKLSDDDSVAIVQDILQNKFRDTDGVIVNLKSNPGGNINFADKLSQLFLSEDKELIQFRIRANDELKFFFSHAKSATSAEDKEILAKINAAIASGVEYSDHFPIGLDAAVHQWSTSYFKPVVLLTNSSCYSSCDMFSATLQDYGRVHVLGVDHSTGAGGANVVTTEFLYDSLPDGDKGPFNKLPFDQEMRIAFRETIRGKSHAGQTLEDVGVVSEDGVLRSTLNDVLAHDQDRFAAITDFISKLDKVPERLYFTDQSPVLNLESSASTLGLDIAAIDQLEVFQNGRSIFQTPVSGAESAQIGLSNTHFDASVRGGYLKVVALQTQSDRTVKQIGRIVKPYRILPTVQGLPFAVPSTGTIQDKATLYNFANAVDSFQFKDGTFTIGDGSGYHAGTNAEIGIRVTAATGTHLSFTASLDSEQGFDFLHVTAVADGVTKELTSPLSGQLAEKQYDFDLSEFAGKVVAIYVRFVADENIDGKGPVIKALSIK